jgi:hypothetical protein
MKNVLIAAVSAALAATAAQADDHEESMDMVDKMYIEYVKPDMRDDYEAVISEWNDCILEADSEERWYVYEPHTGDNSRYAYVIPNQRWGDFDDDNEAMLACYNEYKDRYYATISKVHEYFDIYMPEHSHHVDDGVDRKLAMVTVFDLEDAGTFLDNVKEYAAAAGENDWEDPFYFYRSIGGEHGTEYYVVSPVASFADFESDSSFWEMLSEHFGEEKMAEMREEDREAMNGYYTDIWERNDELSAPHNED